MRRVIITSCRTLGSHETVAFDTGVDGLVVTNDCSHPGAPGLGNWHVTHELTGRSLGYAFDGPEQAMYAASQLAGFDWMQDFRDVEIRRQGMHFVDSVLGPDRRADYSGQPITVLNGGQA